MKKLFAFLAFTLLLTPAQAQLPVDGTSYYLPKTELQFRFLVEKTEYTPGQLAMYAERYMKKTDVSLAPSTTHRIIDMQMNAVGTPDTAKHYTLVLDKRFTISQVERMDNGILLAINSDAPAIEKPASFIPARKAPVPDPKNYMNEDILTAGSSAKMAELIAQEIYDIRESRNLLSRGQAEFMPKDGEQLRIMMNGLSIQEQALMQVFDGLTVKDTTEVVISFIPSEPVDHQLFFRFSKWEGFTDIDDLSGAPYYITVTGDIKKEEENNAKETKKPKNDIGLRVNMPTKAKVSVFDEEKEMKSYELFLGQFGETEILSGDLFGKKQTTKMTINPITGGLESIKEQPINN